MRSVTTVAAAALVIGASAQENFMGFNSGATLADRSAKFKADFKAEFETAASLEGAPGKFNSVRLYTNIQAYSQDDPIEAFEAAVETKTNVLLGVWASGTDNIDKEITALKKAVETHGKDLTDLVIGVTIGSEDLYRISATGIKNKSGVGNSPNAIVGFVDDWRKAFKNTPLAEIPVGHADTWDAWGNSTNKNVIDAVDFIAVHEYPYYENGKGNHIDNAGKLFDRAYNTVKDAAGDKPLWVTETGWPYVGETWDEAEASVDNAEMYWKDVGCKRLFNKTPTFWYTLRDSNPDNDMKFAITEDLSTKPRFDLSCPKNSDKDDEKDSEKGKTEKKDLDDEEGGDTEDITSSMASATSSGSFQPTSSASTGGSSGGSNGGSGGGSANPTGEGAGAEQTGSPPDDGAASLKMSAFAMLAVFGAAFALF